MLVRLRCRLDRYDTIGAPSARKLSALALCVLLTLPLPALLERLDVIMPHITGTWLEVRTLVLPILERPTCGLHCRSKRAPLLSHNRLADALGRGWSRRGHCALRV